MGATALAARLPGLRARAANKTAGPAALAFDQLGGPLVAICGLTGGAGATTLAYLLARQAANHSSAPVLVAELPASGGLAALAQHSSPLALAELARAVAEQRRVAQPFAQLANGLRLVATTHPDGALPCPDSALTSLLGDARQAHGLVVLDSGPPGRHTNAVFEAASHLLFALPASTAAIRRVELLAQHGLFAKPRNTPTTLVASALWPVASAPVKQLRQLAEGHTDRLLLVPHCPALAAGAPEPADGQLDTTMAALATVLRPSR